MTDLDTLTPRPEDPAETRDEARRALQDALHEVKRVIVGQDAMLERLLVSLLAGGHVLLEGVPGLAKTLTVKTLARCSAAASAGSSSPPTWCRPTSSARAIYRPDTRPVRHRARPGVRATSCSPTRSTAPRRRSSRRCSR